MILEGCRVPARCMGRQPWSIARSLLSMSSRALTATHFLSISVLNTQEKTYLYLYSYDFSYMKNRYFLYFYPGSRSNHYSGWIRSVCLCRFVSTICQKLVSKSVSWPFLFFTRKVRVRVQVCFFVFSVFCIRFVSENDMSQIHSPSCLHMVVYLDHRISIFQSHTQTDL